MRLRWRLPAVLTACVVVAQLFKLSPLVDVVSWTAPPTARLSYPLFHVVFAPFTLAADWLNGGSRRDLIGFGIWAVVAYVLARLAVAPVKAAGQSERHTERHVAGTDSASAVRRVPPGRRAVREAWYAVLALAGLAAFVAWGYWLSRPIPRLVATDAAVMVLDVHSHTAMSHDGRKGFGGAQNAAWHARAGFDAAFVTDHNAYGAAKIWRLDAAGRRPRLLDGEELSLSGLHLVVLGNLGEIENRPYDASWDSTGALIRALHADSLYLVASLPEYWEHHWGEPLGQLTQWGVDGFEIWTESPRAMDITPEDRRAVIARCRLENRAMFGATDMHGYGNAATVWNLVRLPGWQTPSDTALQHAVVTRLRSGGAGANQVVALRRWLPESRLGSAFSVPINVVMLLRTASRAHALALLAWIWLLPVTLRRREPRR